MNDVREMAGIGDWDGRERMKGGLGKRHDVSWVDIAGLSGGKRGR